MKTLLMAIVLAGAAPSLQDKEAATTTATVKIDDV